jgi:hypothetical protein
MDCDGVMDFEKAESNAFTNVFPHRWVWKDLFHLKQAVQKKATSVGMPEDEKAKFLEDVSSLAEADTKDAFQELLDEFKMKWETKSPAMYQYFVNQWIKSETPQSWAAFGRPQEAPSGDGLLEGYNNRQQNVVFADKQNLAIDRVVEQLWDEVLYFEYQLASQETSPTKSKTVKSHRRTLGNYTNQAIPVTVGNCSVCTRKKPNQSCSNTLCAGCCVTTGMAACKTHKHIGRAPQTAIPLVKKAIQANGDIWIRYLGGTFGTGWRKVLPIRESIEDPDKFEAFCYVKEENRTFIYGRLLDITEKDPTIPKIAANEQAVTTTTSSARIGRDSTAVDLVGSRKPPTPTIDISDDHYDERPKKHLHESADSNLDEEKSAPHSKRISEIYGDVEERNEDAHQSGRGEDANPPTGRSWWSSIWSKRGKKSEDP